MPDSSDRIRGHVTTESTGKGLKLQQLLAILLLIVGFCWMVIGSQGPRVDGKPPAGMMTGGYAAAAGMVWYVTARVLRWWHHG